MGIVAGARRSTAHRFGQATSKRLPTRVSKFDPRQRFATYIAAQLTSEVTPTARGLHDDVVALFHCLMHRNGSWRKNTFVEWLLQVARHKMECIGLVSDARRMKHRRDDVR